MTDDLPAQDHFREGLVSLMALAHQQMEPQEVVFFWCRCSYQLLLHDGTQ